ncbi:MAG: phosphoribosylglycinamide formyltransferase [Chthonomonas sp.]|nr:phosphoribosylglycinamide formyltransferase [Chthonomonas sp.]
MVGILIGTKGRGSNMAALIQAGLPVALVVAPSPEAPGLARAAELGVPTLALDPRRDDLVAPLKAAGVTVLCLAGYLRLLPDSVLDAFPGRVLNIHPALLPRHGGKGMYGMHVHEAVVASGDTETGCTVHQVTSVYDDGQILGQLRCPVHPGDTANDVAARVLALEHELYPSVVRSLL